MSDAHLRLFTCTYLFGYGVPEMAHVLTLGIPLVVLGITLGSVKSGGD